MNSHSIEVPLMVSSLLDFGSSSWTLDLLKKSSNTPNLYNIKASKKDMGMKWCSLVSHYISHDNIHPVAIIRNKNIIRHPNSNTIIQNGDAYLVISKSRPKKNKMFQSNHG